MANQEQLDLLKQRVETWSQWRKEHDKYQQAFARLLRDLQAK